ncbi:MAG: hypothetical protein ACRD30_03475 [Bryobacteraceae bacterium]
MHSALAILLVTIPLTAQVNVLTYQYDNTRAGTNSHEAVLTPANVNPGQFGKLFSYPVDGFIYGQPMYLANVQIAGKGTHNVVYVATEHDSVYAFDADSNTGGNSQPLWHDSFINPANGVATVPWQDTNCTQIDPEIGITSTPVIDPASGTIYFVAMTKEPGTYVHRLHALDVASGAEKPGSPVVIQASVPGTGDGGSTDTLIPLLYKQRPGILLLNGVVYLAFSSHCDIGDYHGWLLGYDAHTLQQVSVFNSTPNGLEASFWNSGAAPAADSSGNIYIVAGNGDFDAQNGGQDYGESFLKLSTSNGLQVADYFTPFNFYDLNKADADTGSAGVAFIGDEAGSAAYPHLMVGGGKEGRVYLIDRDNLGKFNLNSDQVVQSVPKGTFSLFGNPAYFNRTVYFCTVGDGVRAFPISNAHLGSPTVSNAITYSYPGCVPTISANGTQNGILWSLDSSNTLRAYDASNVLNELYDSDQNPMRDSLDSYVKFSVPTVANGKVYAGTQDSLAAFGLLDAPPPASAISVANAASGQVGIAAPGSLISIFGTGLAQSTASAGTLPLPATLGGATVSVGGVPAPLLYTSSGQINAQVPYATPVGNTSVTTGSGGSVSVSIQAVAPGLFLANPGQAAAANQDGTVNGPDQPAPAGSAISAYLTGLGSVDNPVADGAPATANPLSYAAATVTATIGGQPAQVLFAGLAPGFAAVFQVNIAIPQLAPGAYPLQVIANGAASNTASVYVK